MNPMTTFMKKQGVKVALPLLLFATACGEGTGPVAQGDSNSLELDNVELATTDNGPVLKLDSAGNVPDAIEQEINLDDMGKEKMNGSFDGANPGTTVTDIASNGSDTKTAVPEPTTLAGLAIAALGLGAIKRKQAA